MESVAFSLPAGTKLEIVQLYEKTKKQTEIAIAYTRLE